MKNLLPKMNWLMRIAIVICVIAILITIYDRFIDSDPSENLSVHSSIVVAIGLFLMAISQMKNSRK